MHKLRLDLGVTPKVRFVTCEGERGLCDSKAMYVGRLGDDEIIEIKNKNESFKLRCEKWHLEEYTWQDIKTEHNLGLRIEDRTTDREKEFTFQPIVKTLIANIPNRAELLKSWLREAKARLERHYGSNSPQVKDFDAKIGHIKLVTELVNYACRYLEDLSYGRCTHS